MAVEEQQDQPGPGAEGQDEPGTDQQTADQPTEDQEDPESEEERLARLDAETEDDKADKPLDAVTWGSTGHAAADEALRIIQNVGLSTDDAQDLLLDAAMSRDPSKVDQKALTAKIGPRRTKAIMEALETFSNDMRPRDERISNEVWQFSNGPKALEQLIQQGSEKLSPAEMQGYLIEIGKGGASAQRAVERLQATVKGEGVSLDRQVHTEQYSAPKAAPQPGQTKGITSKAYVTAMEALHGNGSRLSFETREQREQELREARRIGREHGLP
ncbi:hypothetical protein [Roseovarius sp. C03]|uniref:hypothetical protein n=1 Tax=Roseovarius sp. C03 TaxID=3449222 RepID=UPI003EDBB9AC